MVAGFGPRYPGGGRLGLLVFMMLGLLCWMMDSRSTQSDVQSCEADSSKKRI